MIYHFDPQHADQALNSCQPAAGSFSLDTVSSQVKHLTDLLRTKTKLWLLSGKKRLWVSRHSIKKMNRLDPNKC